MRVGDNIDGWTVDKIHPCGSARLVRANGAVTTKLSGNDEQELPSKFEAYVRACRQLMDAYGSTHSRWLDELKRWR